MIYLVPYHHFVPIIALLSLSYSMPCLIISHLLTQDDVDKDASAVKAIAPVDTSEKVSFSVIVTLLLIFDFFLP